MWLQQWLALVYCPWHGALLIWVGLEGLCPLWPLQGSLLFSHLCSVTATSPLIRYMGLSETLPTWKLSGFTWVRVLIIILFAVVLLSFNMLMGRLYFLHSTFGWVQTLMSGIFEWLQDEFECFGANGQEKGVFGAVDFCSNFVWLGQGLLTQSLLPTAWGIILWLVPSTLWLLLIYNELIPNNTDSNYHTLQKKKRKTQSSQLHYSLLLFKTVVICSGL